MHFYGIVCIPEQVCTSSAYMCQPVCLQSSKHEDRKLHIEQYGVEKPEKKERSSTKKDKREKISDEEKELRKERKMGRKRVI